jgi:5'-nucleotidase
MQPFGNSLVVMTLSGAEFKQMLEDQQRPGRDRPHFLIPSSSLSYRWVPRRPRQRVKDLRSAAAADPAARRALHRQQLPRRGRRRLRAAQKGRNRLGGELDSTR